MPLLTGRMGRVGSSVAVRVDDAIERTDASRHSVISTLKRDIAMNIPASLTFYMELGLEMLLALTLCYCVILERRLAAVRKGQEGLSRTIGELNMAISGAGASLRALKAAAG